MTVPTTTFQLYHRLLVFHTQTQFCLHHRFSLARTTLAIITGLSRPYHKGKGLALVHYTYLQSNGMPFVPSLLVLQFLCLARTVKLMRLRYFKVACQPFSEIPYQKERIYFFVVSFFCNIFFMKIMRRPTASTIPNTS